MELELLVMLNFLQFIFLGIRLDRVVEWSWAVSVASFPVSLLQFYVACYVHSSLQFLHHL